MADLAGLYAALPTAFAADFSYDGDAQRALAHHAVGLGLDGVFVGGSTAEVHQLSIAEREAQLADVVAAVGDRTRCIAHVAAMRMEDALGLTRASAELGYVAVASTPPFYSPFKPADRKAFFVDLIQASRLPVFLYHIPQLTGLALGHDELLDLMALDGIVGMKLSASDIELVQKVKTRMPEKLVLFGSDQLLLPALAAGADGGVGSTYNLFGRRIVGLRDAVKAGDLDRARRLQAEINQGIAALVAESVFPALKAGLALAGVPCGPCRPPALPLDEAAMARLESGLALLIDRA
jgi:N-acetylneuraminate lyase